VDNIEWVKIILDGLKVQYTELNCDLPENRDERSRLWGISGKRAVYPQLFLGDEFIGDREDLEARVSWCGWCGGHLCGVALTAVDSCRINTTKVL